MIDTLNGKQVTFKRFSFSVGILILLLLLN